MRIDSCSESLKKNEYAVQKILTSILFELFDFKFKFRLVQSCYSVYRHILVSDLKYVGIFSLVLIVYKKNGTV